MLPDSLLVLPCPLTLMLVRVVKPWELMVRLLVHDKQEESHQAFKGCAVVTLSCCCKPATWFGGDARHGVDC